MSRLHASRIQPLAMTLWWWSLPQTLAELRIYSGGSAQTLSAAQRTCCALCLAMHAQGANELQGEQLCGLRLRQKTEDLVKCIRSQSTKYTAAKTALAKVFPWSLSEKSWHDGMFDA